MAFLGKPVIHLSHSLHDGWMYGTEKNVHQNFKDMAGSKGMSLHIPHPFPSSAFGLKQDSFRNILTDKDLFNVQYNLCCFSKSFLGKSQHGSISVAI